MRRGRGTDFSDIVAYIPGDDTRDISWKHSARLGTLEKKIRLEEESFPIMIVDNISENQLFSTEEIPESPYSFAQKVITAIENSAKKYHFPIQTSWAIIQKENIRNTMILSITTSLDMSEVHDLLWLTRANDVIFIHIFHPYELSPDDKKIFMGLSLKRNQYTKEFSEKRQEIQDTIRKRWWDYIMMTTDMDISQTLNNFFKNRYKYN